MWSSLLCHRPRVFSKALLLQYILWAASKVPRCMYVCVWVGAHDLGACRVITVHVCVLHVSDSTYRLSSPVIFQVQDVAINSMPHIHRRWPCWRLQLNKKTCVSRSSPWHHSNYIRTSIAHFVQHVPLSSYSAQPLPLHTHMHSTAFRIGVGSACTYKRVHVPDCAYRYIHMYVHKQDFAYEPFQACPGPECSY